MRSSHSCVPASQIEDVAPFRRSAQVVKQRVRLHTKPVLDASINVIGVLDNVSQAIGQPLGDVRQLQDDVLRWDAVVDEARAFLKSIEGSTLNRRDRLTLIATQAYGSVRSWQRIGQPCPCRISRSQR